MDEHFHAMTAQISELRVILDRLVASESESDSGLHGRITRVRQQIEDLERLRSRHFPFSFDPGNN